jgi:hypothetical protein
MNAGSWTLVDGHVHVHPQFSASRLLDAAAANLGLAAERMHNCKRCVGVLLLAETQSVDWFRDMRERALRGDAQLGSWSLHPASEHETLIARSGWSLHPASEYETPVVPGSGTLRTLFVISGRQIVTSEHIEVLALLTCGQFEDGRPLEETLEAVHSVGALVVLPWGVGKWFGRRGRLVRRALTRHTVLRPVLAGDNGGRPWCWPRPRIFATAESSGAAVLPGTDPLPLPDQASRVGSFGLAFAGRLPAESLAAALRCRLAETAPPRPPVWSFGEPERVSRFLRNQIRLRIRPEVA